MHSSSIATARRTRAHALFLLASALTLCGCGRESSTTLSGERVVGSLLTYDQSRQVLAENAERPVRVRLIQPRKRDHGSHELLPALEMAPPAKVELKIPALGPGATLEFATGLDTREWASEGRVRFQAHFDGESILDQTRELGEGVPYEERTWRHERLAVPAGGTLTLETSYEGPATHPILAGFGPLHVVAPYEHERERATPEQPNVVLILIDTLRADRLHVYGNPKEVSPRMDALAHRGTLFERAYSATPWTPPSTASVLTGFSPPAHGLGGTTTQYLSEELTTLAERFLDEGFDTAAYSSNPLIVRSRNFSQGFRTFEQFEWTDVEEYFDTIADWVRGQGSERYFLYLHLTEPHDPYEPAADLAEAIAGPEPEGLIDENLRQLIVKAERLGPDNLDSLQPRNQRNLALYDAEIATVDRQIGRLLALLEELGQLDRTIVAVTSDHGEEFLEHGMVCHSIQLYDESVRVPLFLAGPGVPEGRVIRERVPNFHIGSTLLRLAGVEARGFPESLDLIQEPVDHPIFVTTSRGVMFDDATREWVRAGDVHGVRTGRWYLDWSPAQGERKQELVRLCDLRSDPEARVNVAAENKAEVERLKTAIQDWLESEKQERPQLLREGRAELDMLKAAGYVGGEEE